jgi:TRAP-type C4-dicarboxylate transport system substrate-binding protein
MEGNTLRPSRKPDAERCGLRTSVALFLCAATLLLAAPRPARAEEEAVRVRLATLAPDGSSWHQTLKKMGERWKQAPGGGVRLTIYAGGVQGDEADVIRKMRVGQIQAAAVTAVGMSEVDPGCQALQIPMMFRSHEELDYVRDHMKSVLEKRLADKGFVVLNWGEGGWIRFFAKDRFAKPDDLKKMKLFVWTGDAASVDLWKSYGFNPVPLASTDVLTSLQTGLITAFDTTPLVALSSQWFGLAKHMLDLKWAPLIGGTIMTKAAWDKIPAAARPEVLKAAQDAGESLKDEVRAADQKAIDAMKDHGLMVEPADAAVEEAWRQTAESAWPKIRGNIIPADMFDEVRRLRDEYRAQAAGTGGAGGGKSPGKPADKPAGTAPGKSSGKATDAPAGGHAGTTAR